MGGELVRGTYRYHLADSEARMRARFGEGTLTSDYGQELDEHSQQGRTTLGPRGAGGVPAFL